VASAMTTPVSAARRAAGSRSDGSSSAYPGDVAHVFDALEPDTVAVLVSEHV
jgi:hypothetical protein